MPLVKHHALPYFCLLVFLLVSIGTFAQKPGGGVGGAAGQAAAGAQAQGATSPGQGAPGAGSPSGGAASLSGITFTRESWPKISHLPAPAMFDFRNDDFGDILDYFWKPSYRKDVIIFCYDLVPTESGTQPFVLEPVFPAPKEEAKELCANQLRANWKSRSLLSNKYLVFRINISKLKGVEETRRRIEAVNLNVSTQPGSSMNSQRGTGVNPTTARPSLALLSPNQLPCTADQWKEKQLDKVHLRGTFDDFTKKLNVYRVAGSPLFDEFCPEEATPPRDTDNPEVIYLAWPGALVGDTVSSASINFIYNPVAPGLKWQSGTYYPAGSIVSDEDDHSIAHGHYFMAVHGGIATDPSPKLTANAIGVYRDPDGSVLEWQDMGLLQAVPTPPVWQPGHQYVKGALVIEAPVSGSQGGPTTPGSQSAPPPTVHYYEALEGGVSGSTNPAFTLDGKPVPDHVDKNKKKSDLVWKDKGPLSIYPPPSSWIANAAYAKGAAVAPNPSNGHYYTASSPGVSGANQPAFPVSPVSCTRDHQGTCCVQEFDALTLVDAGTSLPTGAKPKLWAVGVPLFLGDVVEDRSSGHYFVVTGAGIPATENPNFEVAAPNSVPATTTTGSTSWIDIGSTLPASASMGTQPGDQTVNLLGLTFPQTQVLDRFNLAAGVVLSSLIPPAITSFSSIDGSKGGACPSGVATCTAYTATKGSHIVDPVLGVSVYLLKPMDAERNWEISDLLPAPTIDISLSSPSSNFHIGAASEFARNLQLVYGVSAVDETRLGGKITTFNGSPTSLITAKKFNVGGFFGVTFNITGFIQTLIP